MLINKFKSQDLKSNPIPKTIINSVTHTIIQMIMIMTSKNPWKSPMSTIMMHKKMLTSKVDTTLKNMLIFKSANKSKNSLSQSKSIHKKIIQIHSYLNRHWYKVESFHTWLYSCSWWSRCISQNAQTWWTARSSWFEHSRKFILIFQDEPCLNQSDKAKIELMMMNNRKQYIGGKYSKVHSIEQA